MKKFIFALCGLLIFLQSVSADIFESRFKIAESEKEFDVLYYVTPDMKVIESKDNNDIAITQSFEIKKNTIQGEARYSLFTDLGGDAQSLGMQYAMWVFMCTNNIAGYEVSFDSITSFNDSDVKNEFNGDFGCTTFIKNPLSEYAEGYNFMMVEFFYRAEQGLVMRAFLFNDFEFLGIDETGNILTSSPLFSNYHTFRFMDKDSSGNYIKD